MGFLKKYKTIILAIVIIIVLFFAYNFFFAGDKSGDRSSTVIVNTPNGADIVGAEIIQALNQIESLKLDRTIFSDPVYRSLVDRSQVIPAEEVGKENPFDPIDTSGVAKEVLDIKKDSKEEVKDDPTPTPTPTPTPKSTPEPTPPASISE